MYKKSPSHPNALLRSPLWEKHEIQHQVKVTNGLSRVLSPQHVKTQLDAWHNIQINNGPFKAKAYHAMEVIGSHCYLLLSNMKGMSSIPLPFDKALHQSSTCRLFWKKAKDRLEARFLDVSLGFRNKEIVPLYHLDPRTWDAWQRPYSTTLGLHIEVKQWKKKWKWAK